MKKKIIVLIPGKRYVNHYLRTNALEEIKTNFEVSFLILKGLNISPDFVQNNRVEFFEFESVLREKHSKIFGLLAWRSIEKSKSFRYRIFRGKPVRESRLIIKSFGRKIESFTRLIAKLILKISISVRLQWHIKTLKSNKQIFKVIKETNPVLVLCPNNAHDAIGSDVVKTCEYLKIPTLFLIDNWDNLSSKSLLWPKPSYLTVWGEQSVTHGVEIQEIDSKKIFPIGTPRYDKYFELRNSRLESKFEFPYVLFVGTYLKFDEIAVLGKLNQILQNKFSQSDLKIIYRPHPEQDRSAELATLKLDRVLVDPKVGVSEETVNGKVLPISSTYFPNLILNSEFVMGGLTSMLIEATIFWKRFLALTYDDGQKYFSPKSIYENYTHFEGIDKLPNITFCSDLELLEDDFMDVWSNRELVDAAAIDQARNYFYFSDEMTYANRLGKVVTKIVNNDEL